MYTFGFFSALILSLLAYRNIKSYERIETVNNAIFNIDSIEDGLSFKGSKIKIYSTREYFCSFFKFISYFESICKTESGRWLIIKTNLFMVNGVEVKEIEIVSEDVVKKTMLRSGQIDLYNENFGEVPLA